MKQGNEPSAADASALFIGWDVGGWNCDKNPASRDALVVLDAGRLRPAGDATVS